MADLTKTVRDLYREQFPDHGEDDAHLKVLEGFAAAVDKALNGKTKSVDPATARKGGA